MIDSIASPRGKQHMTNSTYKRIFSTRVEGPLIPTPEYVDAEQWDGPRTEFTDDGPAGLPEIDHEQAQQFAEFLSEHRGPREVARWHYSEDTDDQLSERERRVVLVNGTHYCGYTQTALPHSLTYDEVYELCTQYGIEWDIPTSLTYGTDADGWVGFDLAHAWDVCADTDGVPFPVKAGRTQLMYVEGPPGRIHTLEMAMRYSDRLGDIMAKLERVGGYHE